MKKYLSIILFLACAVFSFAQDPAYPPAPPAPLTITAAEYFIDIDPGVGQGTAITITPAVNITNLSVSINTSGLSNGVHRLFVRTRNAEGSWSIANVKEFLYDADVVYIAPPPTPQNIIAAEYFIDTDPGFGNGTAIAITPGIDLNNIPVSVNTAGLSNGNHRLYIRTKSNEGRWSITMVKEFIVAFDVAYPPAPPTPQNIVAAEYFIDTDPGFGSGTTIPITPGVDLNNVTVTVNTSGLPNGSHRLYIRTKNNEGHWSIVNVKDFIVDSDLAYPPAPPAPQNIIAAEYFIDTDPGLGNANSISITPGVDISNIPVTINTTGLTPGAHNLFIRTRGAEGGWSTTNHRTFNIGTLTILPDSIVFTVTIINVTVTRSLVVKNNSGASQTITGVTVGAPFGSDFTTTRTVAARQTDTIRIIFTPTAEAQYQSVINLQTSAGAYTIPVKGTAVATINAWVLEPATGHDYGNIQTGSSSNFNFSIRNTGNAAITLNQVSSSNATFVPSYTTGTIIPVNGTINLPVAFNPTTVGTYSAVLKIKATAGGPDSVTTLINGTAFTPATPPTLSFITTSPYDGVRGVNPAAGQTGNYTYKVLYRSADNRAPAPGYPKLGVDANGDQDFTDGGEEGMFAMTPENSSTDYINGVVYSYTVNFNNYSNTLGYRFFAQDALGNDAVAGDVAYNNGPIVTYQMLDLKLFANDITFSKNNPAPGETFIVTAKITNSSAFDAVNVPVSFYRDTILIGSTTLAAVNAFSTATVTRTLSFGADGFYPIKVWVDPNKTLNESNVLNNYAIRPIIVGTPTLPGGITITASESLQTCPAQKLVITGHADYFGTSIPSVAAGAEVTVNTGTAIVKGATDAAGNFTIIMENPPCGGTLVYTVSVTDFTFTSNTATRSVIIQCIAPGACTPPGPKPTTASVSFSAAPCTLITGSSTNGNVTIKYRGRNAANMWSLWDKIWKDTVKIFVDGVLVQTLYSDDIPHFGSAGAFPGNEKTFSVPIHLGPPGAHTVSVIATYVYNEFFQNEDNFYHGVFTPMTATGGTTLLVAPDLPDLTLDNFKQPQFRTLTFEDKNLECVSAGAHVVQVVDITIPGSPVLIHSTSVAGVSGKSSVPISVSLAALSTGTHTLRVITDTTALVTESNEGNNVFHVTLTIPAPDLTVSKVLISPTNLSVGSTVRFTATIKNTGTAAGSFTVRFLANGVPIGLDLPVTGVAESSTVTVTSNPFTITTADSDCPVNITVEADAGLSVTESNESNNSFTFKLGSDINPAQLPIDFGSSANPVQVRVNTPKLFDAYIRNTGTRDISNVTVRFMHNGAKIGEALIPVIKAGEDFPAVASFTHTFTTPGLTSVSIVADTANAICENDETNNTALFRINVTDSKEDYEVLSQYISPSSLNPNAGQNITIVGTVKNVGNRLAPASTLRFFVDDIPLGNEVPFNSLQIGQDTTVAATVAYSSIIQGVKVIKMVVDANNSVVEENELNNEATRTIIVGNAPDMAANGVNPIRFSPATFVEGENVNVSFSVINKGTVAGTAWARFTITDKAGTVIGLDSVQFTLNAGAAAVLTRNMLFDALRGKVTVKIVRCTPGEYDLLNNTTVLEFSTVIRLKTDLTVSGDLDMKAALPDQLPGWIGGKLQLGDYNLIVNGKVLNYDTAHFIITDGAGKLTLKNNSAANIFPVGTSEFSSNFVKLNNTGTLDNFSARAVPYLLINGTTGDTVRRAIVNRTWFIEEELPGGSNASVELFWFAPHELSGFDRNMSRVAHYTSSWQLGVPGAPATDTIADRFSKLQAGYSTFSPFAVSNNIAVALPLRLLQFAVARQGTSAILNWKTTEEVNTSRFVIEYSANGQQFVDIGTVAANNRPGNHSYQFVHTSINAGANYYRLKMIDIDGRFTYSDIKVLRLDEAPVLQVFPNPARQFITVSGLEANGMIELVSAGGSLVRQLRIANGTITIDISNLPGGVYILLYKNNGKLQQQKIIKE